MKKLLVLLTAIFFLISNSSAQDTSLYTRHVFVHNNDTLPYRLLLPINFDPHKRYPMILFLHGSGERGNDNEKQLVHGGHLFLTDSIRKKYPAIVVFPQCAANSSWGNLSFHFDSTLKKRIIEFKEDGESTKPMKLLLDLVRNLEDNYRLDKKRMYVGGLSMGGMGTYELVRRKPGTFAAAFAICGGASVATAGKMKKTAWWIFHGLKDPVVDPEFSKDIAEALKKEGADVKITLYPEDGHDSWDDAFKEPDLFSWMFSHKK
jgi:predicted peptidase